MDGRPTFLLEGGQNPAYRSTHHPPNAQGAAPIPSATNYVITNSTFERLNRAASALSRIARRGARHARPALTHALLSVAGPSTEVGAHPQRPVWHWLDGEPGPALGRRRRGDRSRRRRSQRDRTVLMGGGRDVARPLPSRLRSPAPPTCRDELDERHLSHDPGHRTPYLHHRHGAHRRDPRR